MGLTAQPQWSHLVQHPICLETAWEEAWGEGESRPELGDGAGQGCFIP